MSRVVLLSVVVLLLTACGPTAAVPSLEPRQPVASPSVPPSDPPSPSHAPTDRPSPSIPAVTPRPSEQPAPQLTAAERRLLRGIKRDAVACRPVRDELPGDAVAGIECHSDDPAVARIGFYAFKSDAAMLKAYFARIDAEGVRRDSDATYDEEGESPDFPGKAEVLPDREGRFLNAEGYANYRMTMSGSHVYIGILGRTADMRALVDFAWRGVQDAPGSPSLWGEPAD